MTVEELLPRLEDVRRSSRGYLARCPAHHPDKSPSLSVAEGKRGLLVKCWAGCRIEEICASLSLTVKDLFFDASTDLCEVARQKVQRERQRREHERRREAANMTLDACKAAQRLIESRHGLDISAWLNEQLDAELNTLADGYSLLESEGLYEY
jgi:hypothetical protein